MHYNAEGQIALGYLFAEAMIELADAACPADLDGSGDVGPADLAILLGAWGTTSEADLTGDGIVGARDLAMLLGSWGPCS